MGTLKNHNNKKVQNKKLFWIEKKKVFKFSLIVWILIIYSFILFFLVCFRLYYLFISTLACFYRLKNNMYIYFINLLPNNRTSVFKAWNDWKTAQWRTEQSLINSHVWKQERKFWSIFPSFWHSAVPPPPRGGARSAGDGNMAFPVTGRFTGCNPQETQESHDCYLPGYSWSRVGSQFGEKHRSLSLPQLMSHAWLTERARNTRASQEMRGARRRRSYFNPFYRESAFLLRTSDVYI